MKRNWNWLWLLIVATLIVAPLGLGCKSSDDDDDDDFLDDDDDDSQVFEVLSVQPTFGPEEGGTAVVIYGRLFEEGATVFFGDNEAGDVTFTSSTELSATTPAADGPGYVTVKVVNPDDEYAELSNGFRYGEEGVEVDWCMLKYPDSFTAAPGASTETYGHVYVADCTGQEGGGAGCGVVTGQVGYGATGADPSADPSVFTWIDAAYNSEFVPQTGEENNDEHMGALSEDTEGTYAYAYRFSGDGGSTWKYCDLDGSDNGFSTDQMGTMTIQGQNLQIGWCNLQHPAATSTQPGTATEDIYGRVYVAGCTDGDQQCSGVTAQVGWGDTTVDPSANPSQFTWQNANYNSGHTEDNNDEYAAQITESSEGSYKYAYRFSVDGGSNWWYCDLDGNDGGAFSTDQMGSLEVSSAVVNVGWCNIQTPSEIFTGEGVTTTDIYSQVYILGETGSGVALGYLSADLGYGPIDSDPRSDPGDFSWEAMSYNTGHSGDDNDEYQKTLTVNDAGHYAYVVRMSTDGGSTYTYCDVNGNNGGTGFELDQMGRMYVGNDDIGWCDLQHPDSIVVAAGVQTEDIYGQVYISGVTGTGTPAATLAAELGYGPTDKDPRTWPDAYNWATAVYNAPATDNDEFMWTLTVSTAGYYSYLYRFSYDSGVTWTYCDFDPGISDGFSMDDLGDLEVTG